MASQHGWVFTLNNPSIEEYPLKIEETSSGRRYPVAKWELPRATLAFLGCGRERGQSNTPHLQGLIISSRPISLKSLKKLNPRAHWEPMRGSFKQAREYCEKEGKFVQWTKSGESVASLSRYVQTDLEIFQMIQQSDTDLNKLSVTMLKQEKKLAELSKNVEDLTKLQAHFLLKQDHFQNSILKLLSQKKILNTLSDEDLI